MEYRRLFSVTDTDVFRHHKRKVCLLTDESPEQDEEQLETQNKQTKENQFLGAHVFYDGSGHFHLLGHSGLPSSACCPTTWPHKQGVGSEDSGRG